MDNRIEALERRVDELEQKVEALKSHSAVRFVPAQEPTSTKPGRSSARQEHPSSAAKRQGTRPFLPRVRISAEEMLKWAGIGLVVIAMGLLFEYAIDEGWLTPPVRIIIGFATGLILLGLGLRVHKRRPRFGQVLQGGGLATWYITWFASFQVLDLLPYGPAFAGMVVTTLLALALALQQEDAGLAVFGLLGGLATPFLLYTGENDVTALVSYVCLLLAGTTIIYFWKGWRSMLYATVFGGWIVLLIAADALLWPIENSLGDHMAVQLSAVFALLAFWTAPVVRAVVAETADPLARLELEQSPPGSTGLKTRLEWFFRNVVYLLVLATPILAVILTDMAWRLTDTVQGLIMFGLAALFGAAGQYLSHTNRDQLAYAHWLTAGVLFTVGLTLILDGDALIVAIAAEALVVHVLATRLDDRWLLAGAHFLAFFVAVWMLERLGSPAKAPAIVNLPALSDLIVIAIGFAASFAVRHEQAGLLYRILAYIGMLSWFGRELVVFDNGQAFVTAAWSVCGVILLVGGLTRLDRGLRAAGLLTLALVVGKLFIVDLSQLDPLWRIVAFLGVGAGFLLLGWFVPALWKPMDRDRDANEANQEAASPTG